MGSSSSKNRDTEGKARSARIDEELRQSKAVLRDEVKLLLVGPGESGKSTILKQISLAYRGECSEAERQRYVEIVRSNVYHNMRDVITGYIELEIIVPYELLAAATLVMDQETLHDVVDDPSSLCEELVSAMSKIWEHEETRRVMQRSNEFQISDSAAYFFDSLPRLTSPTYLPTTDDILRTRVRSIGITEVIFPLPQTPSTRVRVVDVGGQRSERKKWINCFENVNVLLFVAAVSEYDQKLFEDKSTNRLEESFVVWESILTSRWFRLTSFILFLNKTDLLRLKLLSSPLSTHFPSYTCGADFDQATRFIKGRFMECVERQNGRGLGGKGGRTREPYVYLTCATDTKAVRIVLSAVLDSVIMSALRSSGLA